jgi:hypothetical protein
MTEEEYRKAIMQAAPKPSLEKRMGYLEADAAAQRTAILRLERDNRWHRVGLWVLAAYLTGLALMLKVLP